MPFTITNRDIDGLINSLAALDGRPEFVKVIGTDGSDKTMVNVHPYKLSAKVRLLAAKWLAALRAHAEAVKKAQEGVFKQHQDPGKEGKPPVIPPDRIQAYSADLDELREQTMAFNIEGLPLAHLNVDENKLPVTVLCGLSPIIADEPAKA